MNKYIHSRNPYRKWVDFKALGEIYPDFAALLDQNGKLDFSNREHARILTKCLLNRDYNLQIEFPTDSLSPSLTLKMNYLLWIEDLLSDSGLLTCGSKSEETNIVGLDIGTGGAILFPALAVKHFRWSMIGTESNKEDYEIAVKNVRTNGLEDKISIIFNPNKDQIFDSVLQFNHNSLKNIAFSMSNPPFYDIHDYGKYT